MPIPATGPIYMRGATGHRGIAQEYSGDVAPFELKDFYRGQPPNWVPGHANSKIAVAGEQRFTNYRGTTKPQDSFTVAPDGTVTQPALTDPANINKPGVKYSISNGGYTRPGVPERAIDGNHGTAWSDGGGRGAAASTYVAWWRVEYPYCVKVTGISYSTLAGLGILRIVFGNLSQFPPPKRVDVEYEDDAGNWHPIPSLSIQNPNGPFVLSNFKANPAGPDTDLRFQSPLGLFDPFTERNFDVFMTGVNGGWRYKAQDLNLNFVCKSIRFNLRPPDYRQIWPNSGRSADTVQGASVGIEDVIINGSELTTCPTVTATTPVPPVQPTGPTGMTGTFASPVSRWNSPSFNTPRNSTGRFTVMNLNTYMSGPDINAFSVSGTGFSVAGTRLNFAVNRQPLAKTYTGRVSFTDQQGNTQTTLIYITVLGVGYPPRPTPTQPAPTAPKPPDPVSSTGTVAHWLKMEISAPKIIRLPANLQGNPLPNVATLYKYNEAWGRTAASGSISGTTSHGLVEVIGTNVYVDDSTGRVHIDFFFKNGLVGWRPTVVVDLRSGILHSKHTFSPGRYRISGVNYQGNAGAQKLSIDVPPLGFVFPASVSISPVIFS